MSKSEVYSWRLSATLKGALEQAARAEKISVAQLLERIVQEWLQEEFSAGEDDEVQRRLHEAARACFGTIRGGDPYLAEQASERVRVKIREKHARKRAH